MVKVMIDVNDVLTEENGWFTKKGRISKSNNGYLWGAGYPMGKIRLTYTIRPLWHKWHGV